MAKQGGYKGLIKSQIFGLFLAVLMLVGGRAWGACADVTGVGGNGLVVSFVDARIAKTEVLSALEGRLVYDGGDKMLKICDGDKWVPLFNDMATKGGLAVTGKLEAGKGLGTNFMRLAFYHYNSVTSLPGLHWLHLKTNQGMNTRMQTIEFVGYDFQGSKPIDARIGYYAYGTNNDIIAVGADGTHPLSVYKSADGHVVLAIQTYQYYIGFVLNQYAPNPQGLFPMEITATRWTTSATGAY